jgi:hypothetical protein
MMHPIQGWWTIATIRLWQSFSPGLAGHPEGMTILQRSVGPMKSGLRWENAGIDSTTLQGLDHCSSLKKMPTGDHLIPSKSQGGRVMSGIKDETTWCRL